MFDRCRIWRLQLSLRADGALPLARWGALEDHLARCSACRTASEADQAMHSILSRHTGHLSPSRAEALDSQVLAAMMLPPTQGFRAGLLRLLRAAQAHWSVMPLAFFSQIASGALVAASLTVVCVLSALHPANPVAPEAARSGAHPALTAAYNEPPVPLEMLLRNPSPRAALLWTTPSGSRPRASESPVPEYPSHRPGDALPSDRSEIHLPDRG